MPTENELKYVLNLDSENFFKTICHKAKNISQFYINNILRIRSLGIIGDLNNINTVLEENYELTIKQSLEDRVLEINVNLDKRDFEDLINKYKDECKFLNKTRYYVRNNEEIWEIDFFKDKKGLVYFAMAEIEMGEGQLSPLEIPNFIKDNLLYPVAQGDNRFSSFNICNIEKAKELYNKLKV